jgi:hypothetical protein
MEGFQEIVNKCKASVSLTVNQHRDYYQKVEEYLIELGDNIKEVYPDVLAEMIRLDTVVELQFYPNTPVGFYVIYHYDIGKAISEALEILNANQ